jgi:hypothetical protein
MVKLPIYDGFVRLRDRWRRMRRRRSSLAELAACPSSELERIARDVGVTCEPWLPGRQPSPWPMHRRVERRAVRMHEMMQRLKVDPATLARLRRGNAYAEARARCLSCRASEACLRWLDAPSSGGGRPEFCPNLTLF